MTRFSLPPFEINGELFSFPFVYQIKMEDLLSVLRSVEALARELNEVKIVCIYQIFCEECKSEILSLPPLLSQAHFAELDQIFYGKPAETSAAKPAAAAPATSNSSITPQQTKKRPKRLLPLSEDDDGKL